MNTFRLLSAFLFLIGIGLSLSIAQDPKKDTAKTDQDVLQGTWKLIKLESKGKENRVLPDSKLVVDGDRAKLYEGKLETVEFKFKLAPARDPKAIDLTAVKNGKELDTLPAIYSIDKDDLKICINFDKQRPQAFAAPADSAQEILTFKRGEPEKAVAKEFEAKEGFTILLSGKPEEKDLSAPTQLGAVKGKQYKHRHESLRVTFMAQAFDYGDARLPEVDKHLDIERDAFMQGLMGGKLLEEKKIKLGDHKGLELTAEFLEGKGAMRSRIYIVKGRVFMVSAVGVKEDVNSKEADRFLDSFKLK